VVHHPADDSLVRLMADRVERERAVARGVVADRGHAALSDRQVEPQRPVHCHDLGLRRPGRQQPRRRRRCGRRDARAAARPERGQEERYERDSSEQEQADQSPFTARGSVFRSLAPHGQCVRRGR